MLFVDQGEETRLAAAEPTAFTNADRKELDMRRPRRSDFIAFVFTFSGM